MGIKSTQDISREDAIERILKIYGLIVHGMFKTLESISFELHYDIQDYTSNISVLYLSSIHDWTDEMLEEYIDQPYFRESMFDNYSIISDDGL